jgi:sialate O-acetylesterase
MLRKTLGWALLVAGLCWGVGPVSADVKPHGLFTENMVLQQGTKVPVWGTAEEGETVTVQFQGQEAKATTKDGRWQVELQNLKPGGPFPMSIAGKNKLEFKNVLVGEVWIASGQSNMEWPLRASSDPEQHAAAAANPHIRLYTVPKRPADKPQSAVESSWVECGPQSVMNFSAVAYFFARDLQKSRNVPVGMIHTSWGGTPAEAWTSQPVLARNSQLSHYLEKREQAVASYANAVEKYQADLAAYKEAAAKAKEEGKQPPVEPRRPFPPVTPTSLYNGMIAPLIPYAIKGAIWYQGESNAGRAYEYRSLFPAMIQNWRDDWNQGNFPFLFVQLAPFQRIVTEPQESNWAELREAQLQTTNLCPNTGMAVITDVGHETDIHPKWKEPVGARLALAARALAYGEKVAFSGPVFDSMAVKGNKAVLTFKHAGGGLVAKGDKLTGFTMAGDDRKFHNAQAEIQGDSVVVSCDQVDRPVAVRFGWANFPVVNLWNKDGLPASPFRTDDFPITTQPKK